MTGKLGSLETYSSGTGHSRHRMTSTHHSPPGHEPGPHGKHGGDLYGYLSWLERVSGGSIGQLALRPVRGVGLRRGGHRAEGCIVSCDLIQCRLASWMPRATG